MNHRRKLRLFKQLVQVEKAVFWQHTNGNAENIIKSHNQVPLAGSAIGAAVLAVGNSTSTNVAHRIDQLQDLPMTNPSSQVVKLGRRDLLSLPKFFTFSKILNQYQTSAI